MLSEKDILSKGSYTSLNDVKNFNGWGGNYTDLSILKNLKSVEVLSLSVNKINTLSDFQYCPLLKELYLRKNLVKDVTEIAYLQNLKHLKILWLSDNPCTSSPVYHSFVLNHLPNLSILDDKRINLFNFEFLIEISEDDYKNAKNDIKKPEYEALEKQYNQFKLKDGVIQKIVPKPAQPVQPVAKHSQSSAAAAPATVSSANSPKHSNIMAAITCLLSELSVKELKDVSSECNRLLLIKTKK